MARPKIADLRKEIARQRDRAEHAESSLKTERKWHIEALGKVKSVEDESARIVSRLTALVKEYASGLPRSPDPVFAIGAILEKQRMEVERLSREEDARRTQAESRAERAVLALWLVLRSAGGWAEVPDRVSVETPEKGTVVEWRDVQRMVTIYGAKPPC